MSQTMKKLINGIDFLSGLGGLLTGLMMCAGVGLIVTEIVYRGVFNQTTYVAEEYAGYLMAMLTFCAMGYTLRERGHIRMTFIHKLITGRPRVYLDMICIVIGFCFCLVLTYHTATFFWDAYTGGQRSMQISRTFLAIPKFFLPLGASILTLQFLGEFLKGICILRKDTEGITIKEEATDQGR